MRGTHEIAENVKAEAFPKYPIFLDGNTQNKIILVGYNRN